MKTFNNNSLRTNNYNNHCSARYTQYCIGSVIHGTPISSFHLMCAQTSSEWVLKYLPTYLTNDNMIDWLRFINFIEDMRPENLTHAEEKTEQKYCKSVLFHMLETQPDYIEPVVEVPVVTFEYKLEVSGDEYGSLFLNYKSELPDGLRDQLRTIEGVSNLSVYRYAAIFGKGSLFTWQEIALKVDQTIMGYFNKLNEAVK